LLFGLAVCAVCCYYMISATRQPAQTVMALDTLKVASKKIRESITFILGDDKEEDNRYYEEAINFYTTHPQGKTEHLVTKCRSLLEVRNYLEHNRPLNKSPWGLVNLVSHGNQWTGLSVRVTPESKRTTVPRLEEHINNKMFPPLEKNIVDQETEIFLHGCGVGNNQKLIDLIRVAFSGKEGMVRVRASRLFEYYTSVKSNDVVQHAERYLANAWFVKYKMGEKPPANALAGELRDKYPAAATDWLDALSREQPRWTGDCYHYTFEVPVKWTIPISKEVRRPDLNTTKDQHHWITTQQEITDELATLEIPVEKFAWSFQNVYIENEDGSKIPAVRIKGYCTILCVLQALTTHDTNAWLIKKPLTPSLDDTNFYYTSVRMGSNKKLSNHEL
jgi:hypothetical protein